MTIYADVICGQHILLIKANFVIIKNSSAPLRYGGRGGGLAARTFRVSLDKTKRAFNRATNSILSRLQGTATEDVLLHMIRSKSLPILLFASEAINLPLSAIRSLDFCVVRFVMKVLRSSNRDMVMSCLEYFDFKLPSVLIPDRKARFLNKFNVLSNTVCQFTAGLRSC